MKKTLFIFLWIISMSLAGQSVYYVSPDGDDSNAGTIGSPWATWGKAFNAGLSPGDTVYFRGGIYYKLEAEVAANPTWFYPTGGTGYEINQDGVEGDTIYYYAYPPDFLAGNKPILDVSNWAFSDSTRGFYGIRAPSVDYSKFYGLTIRNMYPADYDYNYQIMGWLMYGTGTVIENCVVYNVSGAGFAIDGHASNFYLINCDAYNIYDPQHPTPGQMGSGFRNHNLSTITGSVYLINCRAWHCSDQGFSSGSESYMEYRGCWAFDNGTIPGFENSAAGNGFKLGWISSTDTSLLKRKMINNVALYNRAHGFNFNDNGYVAHKYQLYNNTAYMNGYQGFSPVYGYVLFATASGDPDDRVLFNNISYNNESGDLFLGTSSSYTNTTNSWTSSLGITLSNNDFVLLDTTGITAPRQLDGALPDNDVYNTFLRLSSTSQAIDAGIDVGLPYSGAAPDLGAFEYVPPVVTPGFLRGASGFMRIGNKFVKRR